MIEQVKAVFDKKDNAVCLVTGNSGTGKSLAAHLLCSDMLKTRRKMSLCDTHVPTDPGDNFEEVYTKISPTGQEPLVIVFEEVDGMVGALHDKKISQGQDVPVQIKTKADWNCLLDKIDRGLYPCTILVMTSNRSGQWFDDLDPSYMRQGRVDLRFEFKGRYFLIYLSMSYHHPFRPPVVLTCSDYPNPKSQSRLSFLHCT